MVISFARDILNLKDATSYEFRDDVNSDNFLITDMPDASLTHLGGTMRKGSYKTLI